MLHIGSVVFNVCCEPMLLLASKALAQLSPHNEPYKRTYKIQQKRHHAKISANQLGGVIPASWGWSDFYKLAQKAAALLLKPQHVMSPSACLRNS